MPGLTVLLDRKNLTVDIEADTLRVDQPGENPMRTPLKLIHQLVVMGNPTVKCSVWRALAQHHIPAILLPIRGKGYAAHLGAGLSAAAHTRIAQHTLRAEKEKAIDLAKAIVLKKVEGQRILLHHLRITNNAQEKEFDHLSLQINAVGITDHATERLMGLEGATARLYFKALSTWLPSKWKFNGRNKRPPKDPINALLSLSYALAESLIRGVVEKKGLDPSVGFLHAPQPGRDSLLLDILEPIRPVIDQFVIDLTLNNLNPRHFSSNMLDGCKLTKDGRAIYFKAWALWQKEAFCEQKKRPSIINKEVNWLVSTITGQMKA